MTNQSGGIPADQKTAAERIEEAKQLNRNIVQTLNAVLELVEAGDFKEIDLLPRQMARLNEVMADIRKKEAEFDDKHGTRSPEGEIDFDRVRIELGCRLARLRRCCREKGVSEGLGRG